MGPQSDKPVLVNRRTFREKSTRRRTGLKRTRRIGTVEAADVSAIPVPCAAATAATTTPKPAIEWSLPGTSNLQTTSSYSLPGRPPSYPADPLAIARLARALRSAHVRVQGKCGSCGHERVEHELAGARSLGSTHGVRLPPTSGDLLRADAQPYFLWWTNTTVGEFEQRLKDPSAERRAY